MRNSIRTRLTITFIGLAIAPLVLVGAILAWQSFVAQQQQALNLQAEVVQRVATQVTAFFEQQENQLRFISQVQKLHRMERDQQRSILSRLLADQHAFEELVLLDSQGREQIYLSQLDLTPTNLDDRAEADEFTLPQTNGQIYYSPVRFDEISGEPLMTIAIPLLEARTGQVDGVLIAEIRLKNAWDLISEMRFGPGQSVYIVDAEGTVVAHQNPSVVLRGTHFDAPDQNGIHTGLSGSRVLLAVDAVRLGQQEFYVVAEQTIPEALALGINTVRITVGLVVVMLVLSGVLGLLTVRQIVQPIETMATTARLISAGDLEQQVQISNQDELGVLGEAFNDMTRQLRTVINDLEQQIVERKRAEETLIESEERLRLALDGTTDGIWDWNLRTDQVYFSPHYYTMMGYAPDEFPPAYESWQQLLHPDDAEATEKAVQNAIDEQIPFAIEFRFKAKNGDWRWILGRGKVVQLDEAGKAARVAGSHTDITERKQIEAQIRELNQELEQRVVERTAQLEAANKELEAFSYSVSHDLRAPLRAIDGYTRILVEDYETILDAEGQRVCQVIRGQTKKMSTLIDDLLAFSRLNKAEVRMLPIDMETLVNSVFQEVTSFEMQERIDFQLAPIPAAVGDPVLIHQVWVNLLSNAVKFSSKRAHTVIEVCSEEKNGELIYSISDNGAGFDMQYADKLFQVFQRQHSEREFEGTGVGLAIIHRIINRHGGRVWAEAEVDQGATFYFTLSANEQKKGRIS